MDTEIWTGGSESQRRPGADHDRRKRRWAWRAALVLTGLLLAFMWLAMSGELAQIWGAVAVAEEPTAAGEVEGMAAVSGDLIRNGIFNYGNAAWLTYGFILVGDYGNPNPGIEIWPDKDDYPGYKYGHIVQEIYPPSNTTSAKVSFDYRLYSKGSTGYAYQFNVEVITDTYGVLATPLQVSDAQFGALVGTWQSVSQNLSAADLANLNAARAAGQRVYLLFRLWYQVGWDAVVVDVDNVKFEVEGTTTYPSAGVIAFARGQQLRLIQPDGSNDRLIYTANAPTATSIAAQAVFTPTIYDVAWRPDAGKIAFVSNQEQFHSRFPNDVYTVGNDGKCMRRITNPPSYNDLKAGLDAGRYRTGTIKGNVYYRSTDINDPASKILTLITQGTTELKSLTVARGATESFTIEGVADLGNLLGLQYVAAREGSKCWWSTAAVIPGGTANVVPDIEVDASEPKWSVSQITWRRDGGWIGYSNYAGGVFQVVASGGWEDTWFQQYGLANGVDWSPVDDSVLYDWFATDGGISISNTTSSDNKLITGGSPSDPSWLPDGSGFVFFEGIVCGEIYSHHIASGQTFTLTQFFNECAVHPRVSPDGQYIVFERQLGGTGMSNLWVMKRDNMAIMWPLTSDGASYNPDWSWAEPGAYECPAWGFESGVYVPAVMKNY
jgi:hypothetical protein